MVENINLAIAFTAGIVSFFSPCILPLVPSYLSYMGGISYKELVENKRKKGLFFNSLFFVLGFSLIFVILGITFSGFGSFFSGASRWINIIAGSIVIIMGLNFIFNFIKILNMEKRFQFKKRPGGMIGSVLLGMAFAAGWTPCIGPILSSIIFLAGSSGNVVWGAILLAVYSLGLGLPFILGGLFFSAFQKQMTRIKTKLDKIRIFSGIFLIFIGVLILSGSLTDINIFFSKTAYMLQEWQSVNPQIAVMISGFLFLSLTLLTGIFYCLRLRKYKAMENTTFLTLIAPFRLFLVLFLALLTILSFTGTFNLFTTLSSWFSFQGL